MSRISGLPFGSFWYFGWILPVRYLLDHPFLFLGESALGWSIDSGQNMWARYRNVLRGVSAGWCRVLYWFLLVDNCFLLSCVRVPEYSSGDLLVFSLCFYVPFASSLCGWNPRSVFVWVAFCIPVWSNEESWSEKNTPPHVQEVSVRYEGHSYTSAMSCFFYQKSDGVSLREPYRGCTLRRYGRFVSLSTMIPA